MALQFKRGTNANRLTFKLEAGEPFFVTDYAAANVGPFWIGDGNTFGGVQVTPGEFELINDLSDVFVTSPQNNQHLVWDTASARWVNKSNITVPGTLSAGNISITGPITTNDNFFTLNNDNTTLSGTNNGFTLKRGAGLADVWIRYNASNNSWQFTNDGVNYWSFPDQSYGTGDNVTFNSLTATTALAAGTNISAAGNLTVNGNSTLGSDTNDTVTLNGLVNSYRLANNAAITGTMATTDRWRIQGGGTSDAGTVEIATLGDGNETIFARQYSADGAALTNEIQLMDPNGRTRVLRLGIGGAPNSELLEVFGTNISNFSIGNSEGKFIVTNNTADDLLSFFFRTGNRLQFDAGTGKQWFNSGQTGFNTTNPNATIDVNGTANITGNTTIGGTANITGNLTVDSGVLRVDTATNRVGINNTTPNFPLDVVGDAYIGGNATVTSNLTVNSTITGADINATGSLSTNSSFITLNNDDGSSSGTNNGILLKRGSNPDVWIRYNEVTGKWQFSDNGVNYFNFAREGGDSSFNSLSASSMSTADLTVTDDTTFGTVSENPSDFSTFTCNSRTTFTRGVEANFMAMSSVSTPADLGRTPFFGMMVLTSTAGSGNWGSTGVPSSDTTPRILINLGGTTWRALDFYDGAP